MRRAARTVAAGVSALFGTPLAFALAAKATAAVLGIDVPGPDCLLFVGLVFGAMIGGMVSMAAWDAR